MNRLLEARERTALRQAVALLEVNRGRLVLAVLAGAAGLGSAVGLSAVAAWLIARASQMPPVLELTVASVAVRMFGISRAVMRYVERLASHDVALRGMASLRENLYRRLADAPTDAVAGLRRGDLLARTGSDVDAVGDVIVRTVLPAAVAAVVGLGTVVLVGWLHLGIGAVLAGCLLLSGVLGPVLAMRAARLDELAQLTARGDLAAVSMTMLDGGAELTVSGRLPGAMADLRRTETRLARAKDKAARPAALAAGIDHLATGIAVIAAIVLGVHATVAGTMEPVELAVVVLTPLAAFEGTAMLGPAAIQLIRSAGAATRIMSLLTPSADSRLVPDSRLMHGDHGDHPANPVHKSALTNGDGGLVHDGGPVLAGRDLAVGWPRGGIVADGIDLDLAPGRSVAVVGPSGIGKTTLLLTIAGLIPPHGGRVLLGERSIAGMDRAEASRSVVLTAEDAHVFATTVLENLRVARGDLSPTEATALLDRAGLGAWLEALPDGIDTMLAPDATSVSGGERRRLLLARALASQAPLLLLDEPGEHLDPATADNLVTDLLTTADTGRGVLLVTHRLSPLAAADEVILLGRPTSGDADASGGAAPATVLARGPHEVLIESVPAYRWALDQEHLRGRAIRQVR